MTTEQLLDQTCKFIALGPDERIWIFVYEPTPTSSSQGNTVFEWQAFSRGPKFDIYIPEGPWSEAMVLRFLNAHTRKLTNSDRIDLFLFLHKGGLEAFLQKHRKETHD